MTNDELLLAISSMMDEKLEAQEKRMDRKLEAQEKRLEEKLEQLEAELQKDRLYQENVIYPLLQDIKSCYLSTFARYQDGADRMESAYSDIGLLKRVVQEHSKEIQEINRKLA